MKAPVYKKDSSREQQVSASFTYQQVSHSEQQVSASFIDQQVSHSDQQVSASFSEQPQVSNEEFTTIDFRTLISLYDFDRDENFKSLQF